MSLARLRPALSALLLAAVLAGCSAEDDDPAPATSDDAVVTLVGTGVGQLEAGDGAAAAGTFNSVLALDADNLLAHYNLGLIAQQAGEAATALEHYDAALATDPGYGPALYNKAILVEGDDLDEAVGLYRKAVDAQPEFAPAHMRLGFALVHLGETDEGERHLEEGIRLDPTMRDVEAPSYG